MNRTLGERESEKGLERETDSEGEEHSSVYALQHLRNRPDNELTSPISYAMLECQPALTSLFLFISHDSFSPRFLD